MPTSYSTILDKLQKVSIKIVNSENYTILDDDHYTEIWVTTGASDRTIFLPTLADNLSRKIKIIKMDSGAGDVIVEGEGSETINTTLNVNITEQYGWWEFTAGASEWRGETDGNSSILEVSSETADTGLTLDGTWDDVTGMSLTLTPGKWLVSAKATHLGNDVATYIDIFWGLGTLSGNNAPNIPRMDDHVREMYLTAAYNQELIFSRRIINEPYSISSNTTIYMKAKILTGAMNASAHYMYGTTNAPMYIRARRIA